jgi:two-component system phosphate regulon sensor histidine kinase PhoR
LTSLVIRAVILAAISAAIAIPVGMFFRPWHGWAVFCVGLVFQQLIHFRHFARLDRWTRNPDVDPSLEGEGAWDDIFARLYRHEKELRGEIAQRDQTIELLRAAAQALTDGVVMLDLQNAIMFCNTTAETQLGLKLNTDQGQSILNLVRQPEFVAYLEALDFSRALTLRPERYKNKVYSIHVVPYAGSRRLMQIKDITQADRLDQTRRDFVANVSHELRTPLTVLAGFLETMQEIDLDEDERRRYLSMMADQSSRMQSIVQDLLTLSSIESAPPPDNDVVDMANLINKLRRDAEALSGGRHTIVVESADNGDLRGSEPELVSALANLVTNAVRYTPTGGTITLTWKTSPQGAEFAVQDTGPGIDAKHIPRLTERFYRVDRGRSRDSGGTGLGLAIVKHSLNRHQALLDIKSEIGVGSRFAACFPSSRLVNS